MGSLPSARRYIARQETTWCATAAASSITTTGYSGRRRAKVIWCDLAHQIATAAVPARRMARAVDNQSSRGNSLRSCSDCLAARRLEYRAAWLIGQAEVTAKRR